MKEVSSEVSSLHNDPSMVSEIGLLEVVRGAKGSYKGMINYVTDHNISVELFLPPGWFDYTRHSSGRSRCLLAISSTTELHTEWLLITHHCQDLVQSHSLPWSAAIRCSPHKRSHGAQSRKG